VNGDRLWRDRDGAIGLDQMGRGSHVNEKEDLGHEPDQTHDREFAPVTRGSDARGRTADEESARQEDEASGTGVPGVDVGQPDALPPDEEGVRQAEDHDDSR
jgi:hypothetical protein